MGDSKRWHTTYQATVDISPIQSIQNSARGSGKHYEGSLETATGRRLIINVEEMMNEGELERTGRRQYDANPSSGQENDERLSGLPGKRLTQPAGAPKRIKDREQWVLCN
jgi:hypothetical protein